jgi:hypothetical protein
MSAMAAVACGAPAHDDGFDITFDPCAATIVVEGSPRSEEVAGVDEAIRMWNTLGELRLTRELQPENAVLRVRFQRAAKAFHGVYEDEHGIVFINEQLTKPMERIITIAHEFGHAFGLWHVPSSERKSLMNPGNLSTTLTPEDVQSVRRLWGTCATSENHTEL